MAWMTYSASTGFDGKTGNFRDVVICWTALRTNALKFPYQAF